MNAIVELIHAHPSADKSTLSMRPSNPHQCKTGNGFAAVCIVLTSRSRRQFHIEVDPTSPLAIADFASDGNIQTFLAIRLDHGGYLPTVRLSGRWCGTLD